MSAMIWLGVYAVLALAMAYLCADVDAEFDFTESQQHMAASIVLAALWPLALVYMVVYRRKRDSRHTPSEHGEESRG